MFNFHDTDRLIDRMIGAKTPAARAAFAGRRHRRGETMLHKTIEAFRTSRDIMLAQTCPAKAAFFCGSPASRIG